jgi:aldehyde:ferredoxin oxidoreductase
MKSNDLCDRLGMDTISAGDAIAAYLAAEDEFGNADLVHELLEKVAYREGIGDTLAEGIDRFHKNLSVENFSVKGMEFAAHDGRVLHGQGLSYAVANRGGDHMYASMLGPEYNGVVDPEGLTEEKVDLLIKRENKMAIRDSAIVCAFAQDDYVSDGRMATLLDTDYEHLQSIGARAVELERHFNNQRGKDRADDRLPYDLPDFETALDAYYERRGWTDNGTAPDQNLANDDSATAN